mmetsp:Transcript_7717/g.30949  ORF Transcript_7717/g.30949 Transcript_7717/m.30949 type:complete len:215 (+) Transcript_7717:527-1171(+)
MNLSTRASVAAASPSAPTCANPLASSSLPTVFCDTRSQSKASETYPFARARSLAIFAMRALVFGRPTSTASACAALAGASSSVSPSSSVTARRMSVVAIISMPRSEQHAARIRTAKSRVCAEVAKEEQYSSMYNSLWLAPDAVGRLKTSACAPPARDSSVVEYAMNQESKCLEHTEMTPWESPAMAYMMSESNASLTNLPFDRHAARARLSCSP